EDKEKKKEKQKQKESAERREKQKQKEKESAERREKEKESEERKEKDQQPTPAYMSGRAIDEGIRLGRYTAKADPLPYLHELIEAAERIQKLLKPTAATSLFKIKKH